MLVQAPAIEIRIRRPPRRKTLPTESTTTSAPGTTPVSGIPAASAWAVTGQGLLDERDIDVPSFTISVSQGSVASADSIIESEPSLAKLIPAQLRYVPFEAGVTAIAEMKSGSVQAISGVGNPPVTGAIGTGIGVTVVMGWGFDDDQLLVPASVTSAAQLAGQSVGVLVGSSEDYELLGYLKLEHLTGKVKVVPFADENAAGAAALSGAIDSAYVYGVPAAELIAGSSCRRW